MNHGEERGERVCLPGASVVAEQDTASATTAAAASARGKRDDGAALGATAVGIATTSFL